MKNIVYFDIDGTLIDLSRDFSLSSRSRAAILRLREKGNLAVINTGRSLACIPQEILDLGFDGIIAGCGSYVEIFDNIVHNNLLEQDLIDLIVDTFSRAETDLLLEGPEYVYTLDTVFDPVVSRNTLDLFDVFGRKRDLTERPLRVNKISYLSKNEQADRAIIASLQHQLDFIVYPSEIREGLPKGSSKKTGMVLLEGWLKEQHNFLINSTFAFGDSLNDADMLSYATFGIAMGNSDPEIVHLTDFSTLDVTEEGIEFALSHYDLI